MKKRVVEQSADLIKQRVIAVPPEIWKVNSAADDPELEPTEEELLVYRLGFIFIAYRVDFWWWESIEMPRKFLMTCFLVFLQARGPSQLATGAIITFVFLVLNLTLQPYCTDGLNLQSFSLVALFSTLFCGILVGYTKEMEYKNQGSDKGDQTDGVLMGAIIVAINSATLISPILRKKNDWQAQGVL